MLIRLFVTFLALVSLCPTSASAQVEPPRGTEFWLSFMERLFNTSDPADPMSQLRLEIVAGDVASEVRAEIPGSGWSAVVSLTPGGAGAIIVPAALAIATGSEAVETRGILVTATAPVTVSAISHHAGSADATIVLPIEALARDYVVATYDPYIVSPTLRGLAEFVVVSPSNGIVVEITPSAATEAGRQAGVPFTVALQRGQTYQVQSTGNLTGSRVRTVGGVPCDRLAVFAGNIMALVGECNSVDHLYEQMLPIAALGTSHVFVPFAGRKGGDIVEIVAITDSTLLTDWSGAPSPRLDAGARLRMRIDTVALIETSKPVIVMQYARGRDCDSAGTVDGDPMVVQLRPHGMATDVRFVAPGTLSFTRHFVTIVSASNDTATVRIDGAPVMGFRMVPHTTTRAWIQIEVGPGAHALTGDRIENVTLHGQGQAVSYAVDLTSTPSLVPSSSDVVVRRRCTCDGEVLEAPEGFASYRWSNGDSARSILAAASGSYAVTVDNAGGCTIVSDTVVVVAPSKSATVSLEPRAATVAPGDVVPFTLVLADRIVDGSCPDTVDLIAFRFRATMLAPDAIAGGEIVADTLVGADRILTVRVRRDTVLLDMVAALGDTTTTAVILHGLGRDTCLRGSSDTLARLAFTVCEVGGRRFFLAGDAALIKPLRPNPVRGEATVEFRTLEEARTRLELVDVLGRTVRTLVDDVLVPGDHRVQLDASGLKAGVYGLVLRTPARDVVRMVVVRPS